MVQLQNARTSSATAPLFDWADRIALRSRLWQRRRAVYVQIHSELSSLTDRELADIGLSRAMVRDIALEAALAA